MSERLLSRLGGKYKSTVSTIKPCTHSVSGALDNSGSIQRRKSDINQHIGAALLAPQCLGFPAGTVHLKAGKDSSVSISFFTLSNEA